MLKEFQEFAMRGNVADMAVGIVIGAAFTAIVNSLVNDIIMPPVGYLTGGVDFSAIFIPLEAGDFATIEAAREAGVATVNVGLFINALITFVIVAFALFLLIKGMNRLRRTQEEEPAAVPPPAREVQLLEEIRDALIKPR